MSDVCRDCYPDPGERKAASLMGGHRSSTGKMLAARPVVKNSGTRCATHWRQELKRRSKEAHAARVEKVYGLARGQYELLYEAQGGRCYICQRATGKTRRLSVDHDHKSGYVRGLLCRPCNSMLGHIRDDTLVAKRMVYYLNYPPAFGVLGKVKPE